MKLVYVAGPYLDPRGTRFVEENIRAAEAVALELWKMGAAVICPHANTRHFDGAAPDSVWLEGDLEILRRCDALVAVPNWERSTGTLAELALARELEKPVFCWPQEQALIGRWLEGKLVLV